MNIINIKVGDRFHIKWMAHWKYGSVVYSARQTFIVDGLPLLGLVRAITLDGKPVTVDVTDIKFIKAKKLKTTQPVKKRTKQYVRRPITAFPVYKEPVPSFRFQIESASSNHTKFTVVYASDIKQALIEWIKEDSRNDVKDVCKVTRGWK